MGPIGPPTGRGALRPSHSSGTGSQAVAEEWRHQIVAESGCPLAFTYGPMLDSSVAEIDYTLKLLDGYHSSMRLRTWDLPWAAPHDVWSARRPPAWSSPLRLERARANQPPEDRARPGRRLHGGAQGAHDTPWSATMLGRVARNAPICRRGRINVSAHHGRGSLGAMLTADPRVDVVLSRGPR